MIESHEVSDISKKVSVENKTEYKPQYLSDEKPVTKQEDIIFEEVQIQNTLKEYITRIKGIKDFTENGKIVNWDSKEGGDFLSTIEYLYGGLIDILKGLNKNNEITMDEYTDKLNILNGYLENSTLPKNTDAFYTSYANIMETIIPKTKQENTYKGDGYKYTTNEVRNNINQIENINNIQLDKDRISNSDMKFIPILIGYIIEKFGKESAEDFLEKNILNIINTKENLESFRIAYMLGTKNENDKGNKQMMRNILEKHKKDIEKKLGI